MSNIFRILLVLGIIMGGFAVVVSADIIPSEHVKIEFIIDDADPAEHGKNGWLVAGSGVSSKISVSYTGDKSPDTDSIHVKFVSLDKDTYGDVSSNYATSLPCETVFSASKNTAGNAPISVHINFTADDVGYDYSETVYQKIDHNKPMKVQSLTFEDEVIIAEAMEITLKMEDAYGNTVNSLYEDDLKKKGISATSEKVTFSTTLHAGSGFYEDAVYPKELISVPVGADGSAIAKFKVGTEPGPKYLIRMVPPPAIPEQWLTINAIGEAEPYAIAVSVVPNTDTPPYIPADGKSKFYLTYNLFDKYGNPSGNQTLHFNVSVLGDESTLKTNSAGEAKFTFGPFDRVGLFNIHAYAMENTSVTIDQEIRFTNTAPEEMLLTANPESMPSADVAPEFHASLIAKVIDESGNGVPGEEVKFFIVPGSALPLGSHETNASLDKAVATTNVDGIATVNFTPGRLLKNLDGEHRVIPASENCTVVAKWGIGETLKTRSIVLEWKNYPYLRVETEANPETVEVGNPVDVTIRLIGDGYALYPDPIDVMLCVDRSGSMLKGNPDRMVSLMGALKIFNKEMADGRDAVGLTSFGKKGTANIFNYGYRYWAGHDDTYDDDSSYIAEHYKENGKWYDDYATLDLALSKDRTEVNNTIAGLVPMDATPMRGGLYKAIQQITANGRKDAVQAVILLSDGDYNYYGDPLARGTGYTSYSADRYSENTHDYYKFTDLSHENQNMSVYASNNNITIYSISFGSGLTTWGKNTLEKLATSTGGKYYHAPEGDDLAAIYTDIAGELKTEAGVNTSMDLKFTNIEMNNVSVVNDKNDPFLKYEYVPGISTEIKSWNKTATITLPWTKNQRNDWDTHQSLNFDTDDIGTIHLGQTWQAIFRLNITRAGNFNIFGEGSSLSFNNGTDSLGLPKTYITAVPDLNATGINFTGLEVTNLVCLEAENEYVTTDYLTMNWNLTYSSLDSTTTQHLYYQKENDIWNEFDKKPVPGPVTEDLQTAKLYVADFPPGKYKLRVRATAVDAPDSVVETPVLMIGLGGQSFIKLE